MIQKISLILLLTAATASAAAPDPRRAGPRGPRGERVDHRYVMLSTQHTLLESERRELEGAGVRVLRPVGNRRYLVRVAAKGMNELSSHPLVSGIEQIESARKIFPTARRELSGLQSTSRLRLLFHDDVTFDEARRAVFSHGGWLADPLQVRFGVLNRISAWIPNESLDALAEEEIVFQIHGPVPRIRPANATAALISGVTPLHSAPYDLTGRGVVVSVMDYGSKGPALADITHPEFEGRVTSNGTEEIDIHPTHVIGTIAAKGIEPRAKGMAPGALVQNFVASEEFLESKNDEFSRLSIKVDNNSWGYVLGWNNGSKGWEWYGDEDFSTYTDSSAGLDKVVRNHGTLVMWAAGNDGGENGPFGAPFEHYHVDESEKYCYSIDLTGRDCPVECERCELTRHPADGPFNIIAPMGAAKNVISVGAVNANKQIAGFSARGPARDGRVKPELVAKGVSQYSTAAAGTYALLRGTSMAAPVVTGISALVMEQWERTNPGQPLAPEMIRALLIAGAEDLGTPGPDYTYGFGLVNAKKSVDLIRDDDGTGSRIRSSTITQGATAEFGLTAPAGAKIRATIVWSDLENVPYAPRALINDLDLKLIAPNGATILPFVLSPINPAAGATTGINTVDNVEQVELDSAEGGLYRIRVTGSAISSPPSQKFVLVANAALGAPVVLCDDPFEPNDSEATAWGLLLKGQTISPALCNVVDVDHFRFTVDRSGPVTVSVTATDTPVRVTLSGGAAPLTATAAPGGTVDLQTVVGSGVDQPVPPMTFIIRLEAAGPRGAAGVYQLRATYNSSLANRRRPVKR